MLIVKHRSRAMGLGIVRFRLPGKGWFNRVLRRLGWRRRRFREAVSQLKATLLNLAHGQISFRVSDKPRA